MSDLPYKLRKIYEQSLVPACIAAPHTPAHSCLQNIRKANNDPLKKGSFRLNIRRNLTSVGNLSHSAKGRRAKKWSFLDTEAFAGPAGFTAEANTLAMAAEMLDTTPPPAANSGKPCPPHIRHSHTSASRRLTCPSRRRPPASTQLWCSLQADHCSEADSGHPSRSLIEVTSNVRVFATMVSPLPASLSGLRRALCGPCLDTSSRRLSQDGPKWTRFTVIRSGTRRSLA
ncbi:hypothetical protein PCO31111_04996 [Pandoraea communis]|uniref:Uncharacterized protein n=1 Tax=Pandoraea communis TaxID=2508297 RepID=A0A5E4Z2V1_9BURK|nr:hypothetical protein PCO31111_04996 [Pandoraea communis]